MATKKESEGFSDDEKKAMKERAAELKAQARAKDKRAAGEKDVTSKIAALPDADKKIGERFYELVTEHAPDLVPKTMYGMPGFANGDGKMIVFYQPASKFKTRYGTITFDELAKLDDGTMWPTSWAVTELTTADEKTFVALLKKAIA